MRSCLFVLCVLCIVFKGVHMVHKWYPQLLGPSDERHRAPGPASATLHISPLTTMQLHAMLANEPADMADSRLIACVQRAAGAEAQIRHQVAT